MSLALATVVPLVLFGSAPSWWSQRGVLAPNAVTDDFAPVNQGQLRNIAKVAVAELDAKLSGGAGETLHQLVASWSAPSSQTNDFAPLNLGQLKSVAKPFYDRLIAAGLVDFYPWLSSANEPDAFAIANIGQVKSLFSFEVPSPNLLGDPLGDRVAAGQSSGNLALEAQVVWMWGDHFTGETDFERNYPRRISQLSSISSVSAGERHLAVLRSDGIVWTWGENGLGQLGDGTNTNRDSPAPVPNLTNVVSVKAGGLHTLALKDDGTVVAWGDNYYGQLASGDTSPASLPTAVIGLTNVRKIAAGYQRSVALKNDGTVWTWGYDHYNGGDIFSPFPSAVPNLTDVIDVAAGYEHTVAVRADGTVWAWGSNYANQIGNGNPWWMFQDVPFLVPNLSNITRVASSLDHNLALAADGTVWAWGSNYAGQLGDGTTDKRQTPIQVVGLSNVIAIATAYTYSLAMKADGTVWAWGEGAVGTLPGTDRHVPQQVGLGLLDNNHNGLDDRWEVQYFGNLTQTGDGDFDGDGISNLKEFLRGTNPTDYFNGVAPILEITGGNNQIGEPGTFLGKPFKVQVRSAAGQPLVNAPIRFTPSSGSVAPALDGPQESTLLTRTDVNGEALAYHVLSDHPGSSTRTIASAESSAVSATAAFRGVVKFSLPTPTPTPSTTPPDPNSTPTATPAATSTPIAPYRYAIIDLGKDLSPLRVNNKGWVLLSGFTADGEWAYYRWKAGAMERLTYSGDTYEWLAANDMNDDGVVVGSYRRPGAPWKDNAENEITSGLTWAPTTSEAVKTLAPVAAPTWTFRRTGSEKWAFFNAITNNNIVFGDVRTSGGFGLFRDSFNIFNAFRWTGGSATQLSFAAAAYVPSSNSFTLSGESDAVSRANVNGHYIGTKFTPLSIPARGEILNGNRAGMMDGNRVEFNPIDINEAGIVVGWSGADMVVYSSPTSQSTINDTSPVAINDHVYPAPTSQSSSVPPPTAAPQILAWTNGVPVIWERQSDGQTWHPFGLEEMIPSMDGWQYLDPYDMNDTGLIVGSAWYTDSSVPNAPGEYHAFMLVPCELMVDGNRDGEMSFDDPTVHHADQTSEEKRYRFWVNDDDDGGAGDPGDHVRSSIRDYSDGIIGSIRDLEDFTRLHVNVYGFAEALEAGTVIAAFEWRQPVGDPRVKIYRATSSTTSYIESEAVATSQLLFPFRDTLGEATRGAPLFLPPDFWVSRSQFSNVPRTLPIAWFIFEASGEGKGELILTFWRGITKIGEAPGVWFDLKNVKRMFQRAKATPLDGVVEPWTDENPLPTAYLDDPNGYEFDRPADESEEVIIFVHGIHPPFTAADNSYRLNINTAETVYKRLWHNGYKGRLAFYKWPALNPAGYFLNGSGFEFNQSEYRAFKYGKGLSDFAASLPATYKKHIYAHSQGNAVAAAAFRNYGLKARTWIATQGAIPISCFDENLRHYVFDYVTPDAASDLGYRGFLDNRVQTRIVNFSNNEDTVTGKIWELNHEFFKPSVNSVSVLTRVEYWFFSEPNEVHLRRFLGDVELSDRRVNDPHESMAMAVKSRSRAIAHGVDVAGKVDEVVDLHATFGFGDEHGSQWERPVQRGCLRYFEKLIDEIR